MNGNDCVQCHFAFEERELFPYLPEEVRAQLQGEHDWLKRNSYPAVSVIRHSKREIALFHQWCPAHLVAQAEADHANFDAALEQHALRGLLVPPTKPIATESEGTCCSTCRDSHQAAL